MDEKLQSLPIGIQSFERLRSMGKLYVDKTRRLTKLVEESTRVFLSRPRRFGKSLTLSTSCPRRSLVSRTGGLQAFASSEAGSQH